MRRASESLPLDGKSAGLEKEHTLSVQEAVGHRISISAIMRPKFLMVAEGLFAFMVVIPRCLIVNPLNDTTVM